MAGGADDVEFARSVIGFCDLVLGAPPLHDLSLQRIFRAHYSAFCRNAMYDLLLSVLRRASMTRSAADADDITQCVLPLLRDGLVDGSTQIRRSADHFFCLHFLFLFAHMYSPLRFPARSSHSSTARATVASTTLRSPLRASAW